MAWLSHSSGMPEEVEHYLHCYRALIAKQQENNFCLFYIDYTWPEVHYLLFSKLYQFTSHIATNITVLTGVNCPLA